MIYKIINVIDKIRPFKKVSAHCDIPCKIYDPITSQIAVLTMIRLVDLIEEIEKKDSLTSKDHAQISRLIAQKEEHGHKVKQNVDKSATLDLLEKVNRFSEIFWDSKNIKTFKAVSPYPPEQELVYPDLKN